MALEEVGARVRLVGARKAASEMREVGGSAQAAAGQFRSASSGMAQTGSAAQSASGRVRGMGGAFAMTARAAGGLGVALGAAGLVMKIREVGFAFNQTEDRQRIAFTAMTGSAKEAALIMARVRKISEQSPLLDPANTGSAVQRLMAFGFAADSALSAVQTLGNASAASGRSIQETFAPASLALGQIQSKGKVYAEELNQLAESVALGRGKVAKELGMTGEEFEKALQNGDISAKRGLDAIFKAMEKNSGPAAKQMAETTEGRIATAAEKVKKAAGQLTRPLYDKFGLAASQFADRMKGVNFKQLGEDIEYGFDKAAKGGREFLDAVKPAEPFLRNVLWPLLKGVAIGGVALLAASFDRSIPVIRTVSEILGDVGNAAEGAKGDLEAVTAVLTIMLSPVGAAQLAWQQFGDKVRESFTGVGDMFSGEINAALKAVTAGLNGIIAVWNTAIDAFNAVTGDGVKIAGRSVIPGVPDLPNIPSVTAPRVGGEPDTNGGFRGADTTYARRSPAFDLGAITSGGHLTLTGPLVVQMDGRKVHESQVTIEAERNRRR